MKTLTCREMGGMCDQKITAQTPDEMIEKGMVHLREAHPEMAADIDSMPKDHPAMTNWYATFIKKWEAAPDSN